MNKRTFEVEEDSFLKLKFIFLSALFYWLSGNSGNKQEFRCSTLF